MTTHGPFHSLSDTDKQALTDQLRHGASVLHAAGRCGISLSVLFHAATQAGVHHPRKVPRGDATTTRRVRYLLLRQSALSCKDAAVACSINISTAQDYDPTWLILT